MITAIKQFLNNHDVNVISLFFSALLVLTFSFASLPVKVLAIGQISQQQLEQFKRLPPSQQEALAKSRGVNLNSIKGQW